MVELWGDIGFLIFTFASVVFAIMYLTLSRWYKTFMGTLIAAYLGAVAVLCFYFTLRIWDIDVPAVDHVRLIMFWILALSMISAIGGFLHIQFSKRAEGLRRRLAERYVDVDRNKSGIEER